MAKIIVDIDELIDKLDAMTEDDFVQVILEISGGKIEWLKL